MLYDSPDMRYLESQNLQRQKIDQWLPTAELGVSWGMTVNCYEVSFGVGENVLNLDHGDNCQLCEYTKNIELYT